MFRQMDVFVLQSATAAARESIPTLLDLLFAMEEPLN